MTLALVKPQDDGKDSEATFPHPLVSVGAAMDDAAAAADAATDAVPVPWPSLARILGPLTPGRVTLLTANTGSGKTTVALNLVAAIAVAAQLSGTPDKGAWTYLGTEMRAWELWRTWAAMLEGVPPGVATGGDWASLTPSHVQRIRDVRRWMEGDRAPALADVRAVRQAVERTEGELQQRFGRWCQFADHPSPTVREVQVACEATAKRGARLVVVDHVGRLELGDDYAAKRRNVRRLREIVADTGVHLIGTIQQNREARKGSRLTPYYPPQLVGLEGGGFWEHEAVAVVGVWRPIRSRRADEEPRDFQAARRAVEDGEQPVTTMLEPQTVGVILLKHRYPPPDAHVGQETRLRVAHGRVFDPEAR